MKDKRIISDCYTKGDVPMWTLNPESNSTIEFNKRIKAVVTMYEYLDSKGILKDISFVYKSDDKGAMFSFDTEKLMPYKDEMLASGCEDADIAVENIFYADIKPCIYCGAIQLAWTMLTYRDSYGVSRSWECGMCKQLDNSSAHKVYEMNEQKGSVKAIEYMWHDIYKI